MSSDLQSPFLLRALEPPRYGWSTPDDQLRVPTRGEIWKEFFYRLNFTAGQSLPFSFLYATQGSPFVEVLRFRSSFSLY